MSVLPGALALSTKERRGIACTVSGDVERCGGCAAFSDNVELLEDMVFDERVRSAKAAVLWRELEMKERDHRLVKKEKER